MAQQEQHTLSAAEDPRYWLSLQEEIMALTNRIATVQANIDALMGNN